MTFSQSSRCAVQFAKLGGPWNSVLYFVILKINLLNNIIQLQFRINLLILVYQKIRSSTSSSIMVKKDDF